jgi:putative transcriptional regulator
MKKKLSPVTKTIIETAKGMRKIGLIDEEEYQKITMRLLKKENKLLKIEPITSEEIRAIRKREHISQAVFANYLNLTAGYISELERGLKQPNGAVLALLNIVRHKGLNAIRY